MTSSHTHFLRSATLVAVFSLFTIFAGGLFASSAMAAGFSSISAPANGVFWRGQQTIKWDYATSNPNQTVTFGIAYSNSTIPFNSQRNITSSATPSDSSNASYPWNVSGLANGTNYQIRVYDSPNSSSNHITSSIFGIDKTPPVTTLATSSPATPDGTNGWFKTGSGTNNGAPTITLTCTDNLSGCSSIHYAWYNKATNAVVTVPTPAPVTLSGTPASLSETIVAPEGDNILKYYSEDKAVDNQLKHNVETAKSAEFKVDTIAPTIGASLPASGSVLRGIQTFTFNPTDANLAYLKLTVSSPSAYSGDSITLKPDATSPITSSEKTILDGIDASVTYAQGTGWTITVNTKKLPNGTYAFTAEVGDIAGNTTTSSSYSYVIDNTAPTTTLTTSTLPYSTTGWYNINHPVSDITLTCADTLSGCSSIKYGWYDATTHVLLANTSTTTVQLSSSVSTATIAGSTLHQGDNILLYYSEDKAVDNSNPAIHNVETTQSAEFKVDTTPPSITSYTLDGNTNDVYFNPNNSDTNLASTTIALTASEPVEVTRLYICATSDTTCSSPVKYFTQTSSFLKNDTEVWHGHLSTGGTGFANDGVYSLVAKITDEAGNSSTVDLSTLTPNPTITVDTVDPTITNFTSPAANHVYTSANILTFTPKDTGGAGNTGTPLTCSYTLNGGTPVTLTSCTNGTSLTTTLPIGTGGLIDGRNKIVVTVTDAAGNTKSETSRSFVYDTNKTLTVSGTASDHADFSTIKKAVAASDAAGLSGETISVYPGTYTGDVTLDKPFVLQNESSNVSGTIITGQVEVQSTAASTTIQNLSFTNPDASNAIVIKGASNVLVTGNDFNDIGTTLTKGSAQAIDINGGSSATMSGITISNNTITNVGSANLKYSGVAHSGTSAKGIYIGDSTGTNTISNVTIDGNTITNITASPIPWVKDSSGNWTSKLGRGAYGVLVNHTAPNLTIKNNTINTLNGYWAHAIGLEGNTPNANITGNIISNLTDNKNSTDDVGVLLQDNPSAASITVTGNQFASDIIGVALDPTNTTGVLDATNNWWGNATGPKATDNLDGLGSTVYPVVADSSVHYITYRNWCAEAGCSTTDTTAPSVTLSYSANSAKAGTETITATYSKAIVDTPEISIGQQGTTDITSAAMTTSNNIVWTYDYTVHTHNGGTYKDGTATVSLSSVDDSHGNIATTPTNTSFVIDTVAPTLSDVSIASSNTDTTLAKAGDVVTLNFTASETVVTPTVMIDGNTVTPTNTSANIWTATYAMTSGDTQGTIPFTINYTDTAGNHGAEVTATNDSTSVFFDSVAPTVSAGNDKEVNAQTTQTNATASDDGSGIASIVWSGPSAVSFDTANDVQTKISATTDGTYTLTLTVTDKAGNTNSDTMQFIWDTTAPQVEGVSPTALRPIATTAGTAKVVFYGGSGNIVLLNPSNVTLKNNLTNVSYSTGVSVDSGNGNSTTLNIDYSTLEPNTTYRINVASGAVRDVAGNIFTGNNISYFTTSATPDTTPPAVPVITTSHATVDANLYTITGTSASDGGQRIVNLYNGTVLAGSAVLAPGVTNWTINASLTQGSDNVFTATATDGAGNVSAASNSVTITEAAPTAVIPTVVLKNGTTIASPYYASDAATRFGSGLQFDITNVTSMTVNGTSVTGITSSATLATVAAVSSTDATTLGLHVYNVVVTSSTGDTANITVAYNVVADFNDTASLAVTGIDAVKTYATNDNTYANGWSWIYHITVPTSETHFQMKFSDFTNGTDTIPAGGHMRFYTAQSSTHADATNAVDITDNTYTPTPAITLTSDLHPAIPGRQIDVTVEMKVPSSVTIGGSYSASYGVKTN